MTTLIDGLVAHWTLDESGPMPGGTRFDSHRANDLEPTGNIPNRAAVVGNGADFYNDGAAYKLSIADNSDLSLAAYDWCISLWIYIDALPVPAYGYIIDKFSASNEYLLRLTSAGQLAWIVRNTANSANAIANWGTNLSAGQWYHVYLYHDYGSVIGISVDNGTPVTAAATAHGRDGTNAFVLGGQSSSTSYPFPGVIDEIAVWKRRLLTTDERTAIYTLSLEGVSYPWRIDIRDELVGAWMLEETTGNRKDGVSGNHLTPYNAPSYEAQTWFRGNAMVCDANKAAYHAYNSILAVGDEPFTFSCWVKLTSKPTEYQGIISKWLAAAGTDDYLLYYDFATDRFIWDVGSGYEVFSNALGAPALDSWYQICVWFDPYIAEAGMLVYDTYLDVDAAGTSPPEAANAEFDIGIMDGRNNPLVGLRGAVDEVLFWKRLLAKPEKSKLSHDPDFNPHLFPFGAVNNRTRRGIARGVGRGT